MDEINLKIWVTSCFSSSQQVILAAHDSFFLSSATLAPVGAVAGRKSFRETYSVTRDLGSGAFSVVKLATHKVN
jgi:hypothetical protein